jgi:hypothetical protein
LVHHKIVPPSPAVTLWGTKNPGTHSPWRGKKGRVGAGGGGYNREGEKAFLPTIVIKNFLGIKAKASVQIEIPRMEVALLMPPSPHHHFAWSLETHRNGGQPPSPGQPPTIKKKIKLLYKMWGGEREEAGGD